jgi:hypothetical protein
MQESFADQILGESAGPISIDTREENRLATLALAQQAARTMHVFSHHLDPGIYNNQAFIDAVTKLAVRSRYSKIQILVQDTQPIIKNGHRIIEASRRVSSFVKIRKVHQDYQDHPQAFFIVDETGYNLRNLSSRYEGQVDFNGRKEARNLVKFFDEVWLKSEPEPMLRQL